MKKSSDSGEGLDLEGDPPTTERDTAALRRLRGLPRLDFDAYLLFLSSLPSTPHEKLRRRRGPRGDKPFSLDS